MQRIVFFVNGLQTEASGEDLETWPTLLSYLRRKLGLTGSKNACGQGSCGACSVILSKFDPRTQTIRHVTVNGCITPLYYVHGCAVTTVEGIGTSRDGLHPVQRSLVDHHVLQCGFCTPGMVISLCCLLRNNPNPTKVDVERAIEGNLCRCTGYRPILESMSPFVTCPLGEKCCKNGTSKQEDDHSKPEVRTIDPTQDCIFPPQLKKWTFEDAVLLANKRATWIVPRNMKQLKAVWADNPTACFVAGATAKGTLTKEGCPYISCHRVDELQTLSSDDQGIHFGSAVTFTMMEDFLTKLKLESKGSKKLLVLQAILDCIGTLATPQIRNVATIGGHLGSRCDYMDMVPILFVLEATVNLMDIRGNSRCLTVQEYFSDQQTEKELILNVCIPFSNEWGYVQFYKTPRRRPFDSDVISAVLALGISVENEPRHLYVCFGGLVPQYLKLDLLASVPQRKRTWNDLTSETLNQLLRERLCTEKVKIKDGLINLCDGILRKFKALFDKTTTDAADPQSQPDHYRSTIVFDGVPDDQSPTDPVWRPLPQTTAEDLVSGQAMFIDDIPSYQNELYLCLVLSKRTRARLERVDWAAARNCTGVVDCIDHNSASGSNMWGIMTHDEEVFASEEVVYWGQPIGAVIAESREQARRAAAEVKIDYKDLPPVLTIEDAIKQESYIGEAIVRTRGDVISGFAHCDGVLEGMVCTGAQEHVYMETMGAIGVPKREQNEIEVFVSHQAPSFIQKAIATYLGIPFNKVIVRHRRTGGAFGGKETQPVKICLPVALAAQRNGRPVRCVLSREEDMIVTGKRHPSMCQYKVGFRNDGVIKALDVRFYVDAGCSVDVSLLVLTLMMDMMEGCFSIDNVKIEGRACKTNKVSNTSFRGFGIPQGYVAMETIVDHVAHALNTKPKKIQEINFAKSGFVPFSKLPIKDETVVKAWEQCQKQAKYSLKEADVAAFNEKYKHKKRGLAIMAIRFHNGFDLPLLNQGSALIHVYLDGSVSLSHGGCEIGQGLNMKLLQIASRALEIPLSKIYTTENSTHTVANANSTVGSSTTDIVGAAVLDACREIKNRLHPFKEKKPNASWDEQIMDAYLNRVSLSAIGHGRPGDGGLFYYTYGAGCSMVEIDCLTGEHQVLSTDIVMDVGRSLNPGIDVGQIEGGFLQGYGMVAMEEWRMKTNGEVISTGLSFYKIPEVGNLPRDFNVTLLSDSPNKEAIVYSSKGIGEPPLLLAITVHKAIRAAVLSARKDKGLSDYVRLDTPVSPAMVLGACASSDKRGS